MALVPVSTCMYGLWLVLATQPQYFTQCYAHSIALIHSFGYETGYQSAVPLVTQYRTRRLVVSHRALSLMVTPTQALLLGFSCARTLCKVIRLYVSSE